MNSDSDAGLRKYPLRHSRANPLAIPGDEIDLRASARIHFSSEASDHPIEHMLDGHSGPGATFWRSERPNVTEEIVVEFDQPRCLRHLSFEVEERDCERTQEVRAEYSTDGGVGYRGLFVQEYTFSPQGSTLQCENLSFDLHGVTHLRLIVVPNKHGSGYATFTSLRLFG
jgi:hypothetical protein